MMVRTDHNGQEPAGPMASAFGYQEKSVERHGYSHEGHFGVAILRGLLASLKIWSLLRFNHHQKLSLISFEPPVGTVAHVDVLDICRITAGVGIAAAHLRSCDNASCPCWTCVFPSKPERDTHDERSNGQNGNPPAPQDKGEHENREQDDVTNRKPSLKHGSNLIADQTRTV